MNTYLTDTKAQTPDVVLGVTSGIGVKVLIVDDQEDARWVITNVMRQAGFSTLQAATGEEALASIQRHTPDIVMLDICLPDMDGFEVLTRIKLIDKVLPVIMVTGSGKPYDAARAVRAGSWDYITKPFKNEHVLHTVRNALAVIVRHIDHVADKTSLLLHSMGNSASIRGIQREVEMVANTNFSVLVTGESGTGKELVTQAIHTLSPRVDKPLVAVDCGAITESLIESELFGHEKGAFTGAHCAKAGAFELANGGTIFLDEVGNLPLALQGKLLRVLETRHIRRIGSSHERKVDFRVVSATNANLPSMVNKHEFREDLYHRLVEYSIQIPPLRERKDDLVFLIQRFLMQTNTEIGKQVKGLSTDAWDIMQRYEWHGNVRELRNHLRRAILLCENPDGLISPENLGLHTQPEKALPQIKVMMPPQAAPRGSDHFSVPMGAQLNVLGQESQRSLKELVATETAKIEIAALVSVLKKSRGNKALAARTLQIDYKTIHGKLKLYKISAAQYMNDESEPDG